MNRLQQRQLDVLTNAVLILTELIKEIPLGEAYNTPKAKLTDMVRELERLQEEAEHQSQNNADIDELNPS